MEADPNGTSPGPAQEAQPAREAGEARATALQKARRRCIGKAGLIVRFSVTTEPKILGTNFISELFTLASAKRSILFS